MSGKVNVEKCGSIATMFFDHRERHNAVSLEMWRQIPAIVNGLADDSRVRVVIMRGAGDRAFVSGADISQFQDKRQGDATLDYDADVGAAISSLVALRKPIIAAIHGYCIGGGMALALSADLRYAADDARFAIPAARLGIGYRAAGFALLVDTVGMSAAKEIMFTARRFDAQRALQMSLVNGVTEKARLDSLVQETAETIAANAPLTVSSVKLMSLELAKPEGDRDYRGMEQSIVDCFESRDYAEGVQAFLEKRPPRFEGR